MARWSHLQWPFFADEHRRLADDAAHWAKAHLTDGEHADTDAACRSLVQRLGAGGLLRWCVPAAYGGAAQNLDSRALCVVRETLAWHDALADFAFAMQGLGSGAVSLAGTDEQKRALLPRVARGDAITAFALSEPEAGSDVGGMRCTARRLDGTAGWQLDGQKTWISNGGIADVYTVFARSDPQSTGSRGISAFLVPTDTPGLTVAERIDTIAPHPLARLVFDECRLPADSLLGSAGDGFKLAMATLDIFRASVAAAALGLARRALAEAIGHARGRAMFGATLADQPLAQAHLAEMATSVDAAALLTYRAAWLRDTTGLRTTGEVAMAKSFATESAQRVIDLALQLHGGRGVQRGSVVERLYREIRALRIYEGATEVQQLIIARETLRSHP